TRRLRGDYIHDECRAGSYLARRSQSELLGPRGEIGRERRDAVGERAHEDLIRRRIAHELHDNVAVALEIRGKLNLLDRTRGRSFEPAVRDHVVAFHGDQPGTDVRSPDADVDGVTPGIA